ncbi:MAG: hypothetical protein GC189_03085 [Alphaproteobacteria bacterium]|nr:hypothetical protein [Alphaproteobacteria bacterium]
MWTMARSAPIACLLMVATSISACGRGNAVSPVESRAIYEQPPTDSNSWCSLSGDGSLLAYAPTRSPRSQIRIVQTNDGKSWTLAFSDAKVAIGEAALSPSGDQIVLTASPLFDWRESLWVVDTRSGQGRVIPQPSNDAFQAISYSDPETITYFRTFRVPTLPGFRGNPDAYQPQWTRMYAHNLSSGEEQELSPLVFGIPLALGRDFAGNLHFAAYELLEESVRQEDGVRIWVSPSESAYRELMADSAALVIRADNESRLRFDRIHLIDRSRGSAYLTGVSSNGRQIFRMAEYTPSITVRAVVRSLDGQTQVLSTDDYTVGWPCLSLDGRRAAAITTGTTNGQQVLLAYDDPTLERIFMNAIDSEFEVAVELIPERTGTSVVEIVEASP